MILFVRVPERPLAFRQRRSNSFQRPLLLLRESCRCWCIRQVGVFGLRVVEGVLVELGSIGAVDGYGGEQRLPVECRGLISNAITTNSLVDGPVRALVATVVAGISNHLAAHSREHSNRLQAAAR